MPTPLPPAAGTRISTPTTFTRWAPLLGGIILLLIWPQSVRADLQVGAAMTDVTPLHYPVLVNGGMTSNSANKAVTPLYARAIVVDDGRERLALVVVDSCMMSRELLDEAKLLAAERTKIRPPRMMISATHTHTAPASMGCLGTDADPTYVPYLRERLAVAIAAAEKNLRPARVGWAVKNASDYTALRRWIIRPDRIGLDPFGNPTLRANMHAGANLDQVTGESGPKDPDLSLIAFQALDGAPIALLANFSMHYFSGVEPLHADYFGLFCESFQAQLADQVPAGQPPFVAIMSHGCSGDIWRRDYTRPAPPKEQAPTLHSYTAGLLTIAQEAHRQIRYQQQADVAMAEARLRLRYRVPDKQRLEWAQRIVADMGQRSPKTTEEVYAREQVILHERQSTEIVLQAIRLGEIAIATTPNETYALTGLKLKLQSPLTQTMVIELANGGDGYIPPPEQHLLGGYNTWPARSAGLEVEAEPKITAQLLDLLEQVTAQPRQLYQQSRGPAAVATLAAQPQAYWRLDEFGGRRVLDSSPFRRHAIYEPGVVFFLEGPQSKRYNLGEETNRCAHFAGGRIDAQLENLSSTLSCSLWFWNGMPSDARDITGWLLSNDHPQGRSPYGEHVGLGGTRGGTAGKLIFQIGADEKTPLVVGRTVIERWTWNHLLLVREGRHRRLYLNGNPQPELEFELPAAKQSPTARANEITSPNPPSPAQATRTPQLGSAPPADTWYFGGRADNQDNWEGRLDEIAVFSRLLTDAERAAIAGR
ncbi:MAG: hypothetical protein ACKOU6_20125 [Planctomycetota bacterium]